MIKDVLLRLNLCITKARGQCYDGAAAMSGCRSGVAKRIMDDEPKAIYTHCYGHSLDLAISDTVKRCDCINNALSITVKRCDCINNALSITYEITKLIKKSPQREARFLRLKETLSPSTPGVRVLCPTRWTIRAESLQSIIDNYTVLLETWQESLGATRDTYVYNCKINLQIIVSCSLSLMISQCLYIYITLVIMQMASILFSQLQARRNCAYFILL